MKTGADALRHQFFSTLESLFHDIRYCLRSLRKTPEFTAIATLTLAFGIAANTLVFSVVNAVMLRRLSYHRQERLVVPCWYGPQGQLSEAIPAAAFFLLSERSRSFQKVAAIYDFELGVNLSTAGSSRYVKALRVSSDFFRTVGVSPNPGRDFTPENDQPGQRVTVLSYRLWDWAFNKDPSVLGRGIRINGEPYTIVGIMPAGFRSYPYPEVDLWMPLQLSRASADPGNEYLTIARLKDGISLPEAQRDVDALEKEFRLTFPVPGLAPDARLKLGGLHASTIATLRKQLGILVGAVSFVLLIVCMNLAVLLSVRASARSHETAIRAALGASRARLAGTLLVESALIAISGGVLGIILAKEFIPFMLWLIPMDLPLNAPIGVDGRVILFAVLISAITVLLFGLAPGARIAAANLNNLLRDSSTSTTSGSRMARTGRVLVSLQSALALILLAGALTLLRNFLLVHSVDPGFDPKNVWVAQISLAADRYQTTAASAHLLESVSDRVRAYPGVESVATITGLPLEPGLDIPVHPSGRGKPADGGEGGGTLAEFRIVSADYFKAMRIGVISGRSFGRTDSAGNAPVAMVNETLAKRWWPGRSAVGEFITVGEVPGSAISDVPRQIVGVTGDVRQSGLDQPPLATMFVPLEQTPDSIVSLVNKPLPTSIIVSTSTPPAGLPEHLRNVLRSADPDLSVASWRALADVVSASLGRSRFYTSLTVMFGTFAVLLTAVGLYGLLSYQLVLRRREIGVRMALGASRSEVATMVLKQGIGVVSIGVGLGLLGVPILTRLIGAMVYNSRSVTVGVIVVAALLLVVVAALTSSVTAMRATAVEPTIVLRSE